MSGKYFWFFLSMGITSISVFLSYLVTKNPIKITTSDILFSLFALSGIISSYSNTHTVNTRFILFVLLFILYFYFRIILSQHKNNISILIQVLIITGLIEAIWGLQQLYGFSDSQHNLFNLTGSFFNPGPYGGYLAVIAPITVYYLLKEYKILNKKFNKSFIPSYLRLSISAATLFSILLVLPATMSRASWIAAIGGCSLVCIGFLLNTNWIINTWKNNRKKIVYISSIFIIIMVIGGLYIYQLKKDSADGRVLMWKVSLSIIPDHLTGVGLGNFAGAYADGQASYFESGKGTEQDEYVAGGPEYAFNEYLQLCVELGIIPFLLFFAGVVSVFVLCVKNKRIEIAGSLVALLIFACMSYPFNILPFLIVLVFLFASSSVYPSWERTTTKKGYLGTWFITILSFVILFFCLKNRYPTYEAYKTWKNAKILYSMDLYKETVKEYRELELYLNDQTNFMFEYAHALSKIEEYETSNKVIYNSIKISADPMFYNIMGNNYQALHKYDSAEICLKKAASIIPNRLYPYYLLANMYLESGDTIRAVEMAGIVLTKEPKMHSIAVEEMREEMKKIVNKDIEP
ncbi:MAG: O-antigen ligase family protein [Tissierellia bacterium]|nr:O-antigen ligase family protein [Tissierellia bacterium]